jgi:tetratricopeptide (TPR) repeat protein
MVVPPDRSRILQQAQLFASRGQFEAAIAEWKKLANEMPGDGSIHNTIGDLHLKRNAAGEAAVAFLQAASAFRAEGATLKAIAAFKKVLKCDPTRYEVYRHLGDLNVERGLISSAVQDYLTLGKYYLKERRGRDALEIYKKIVMQDPSNLNAQQRVAELCVQENHQDEAIKVYLQLGREMSAQGQYDEAKEAYLAVLRIDPANSEAAQFVESLKKDGTGTVKALKPSAPAIGHPSEPFDLLSEAMRRMEEKQYDGAEAILNQILAREPGNPQVCQLLARLHLQRGDVQIALGEYRFLAGAALRAHDFMLAESLIQEFLSAEPNSVPLLELNAELFEEKGDHAGAALHYAKAIELLLEHPEPGMETLHEELFEKVRTLSHDETVVNRLAMRIHGGATAEQSGAATAASVPHTLPSDTSVLDVRNEPQESGEVTEEAQGGTYGEAERDDVNALARGPELQAANASPSVHSGTPDMSSAALDMATKEPVGPPTDYEAHYVLGVAYKNMGLYEEAKEEFQVSMNSDSFYLDSALMTAVCLKEDRHIALAIRRLETVLADPQCEGAKGQAIHYELGLLYEAEEQWEKAARAFRSIPSFHDVPQRLVALQGRQRGGDVGFRYTL